MIRDSKPVTKEDVEHYKRFRTSELLRMSRIWEQACEYLLWKLEKDGG